MYSFEARAGFSSAFGVCEARGVLLRISSWRADGHCMESLWMRLRTKFSTQVACWTASTRHLVQFNDALERALGLPAVQATSKSRVSSSGSR